VWPGALETEPSPQSKNAAGADASCGVPAVGLDKSACRLKYCPLLADVKRCPHSRLLSGAKRTLIPVFAMSASDRYC
jgi:hypothetical protein